MATKTKSTVTSKKVENKLGNVEIKKSTSKKIERNIKKGGKKLVLLIFAFLLLGFGLGAGGYFILCRKDCFEIVGQTNVSRTIGEKYEDEGVKIVSFGKNESKNISISTNLKQDENGNFYSDEVGDFYIEYSSNSFKYGKIYKVKKVRIVTFVEPSEGGE